MNLFICDLIFAEDVYGVPLQHGDYILDVTTEITKSGHSFFMLFRRSVWYFPLRTVDPNANPVYIDMMFHQVLLSGSVMFPKVRTVA